MATGGADLTVINNFINHLDINEYIKGCTKFLRKRGKEITTQKI